MNKICTDINQSKKLIELGIDVNTADMYYFIADSLKQQEMNYAIRIGTPIVKTDIPAWSLTALLGLMSKSIISTSNPLSTNYCCRNVEFDMDFYADNPVDAAFEMLVWLKENNLKEK